MSQRIRYESVTTNPNALKSVKTFPHATNGARYRVQLDTVEFSYNIIEESTGVCAAAGRSASLHKVKKAAKEALGKLGITFTTETRRERGATATQDTLAQAS